MIDIFNIPYIPKAVFIAFGILIGAVTTWWFLQHRYSSREGFQAMGPAPGVNPIVVTPEVLQSPEGCKILIGLQASVASQLERAKAMNNVYMIQLLTTGLKNITDQITASNCSAIAATPTAPPAALAPAALAPAALAPAVQAPAVTTPSV